MDGRFKEQLKKQLPLMVENKVIDQEAAKKISLYYQLGEPGKTRNTVLTIIGSLSALLIGSGIILLFAYNWHTIPVWLKTSLSFLPLIAGQGLVFYTWKSRRSQSWQEFSSILLSLSVGSVIALISQIYQIPGDLGNFLLTWMLLILPLIYLTESLGTVLIYLTGILFWCGFSQEAGRHALWYWLLFASVLPRQILHIKKEREANRTTVINWMLIINLLIGTGISLEKVLPGLWILIYSLLFTLCLLIGSVFRLSNPFSLGGTLGTVILSYIFTFEFFWEEVGLDNIRQGWNFHEEAALFDYVLFFLLLSLCLFLLISKTDQPLRRKYGPYFALFPLSLTAYIIGSAGEAIVPQTILFNLYTLFLGGWIISRGILESRLFKINLGMITVLFIIVTRFFDMDIGFTAKGIVFIVLGSIFLAVNRFLSRRMNNE